MHKELEMLRSILTVLSGSVIAQLLAVAVLPILTRLYDADSFGRYQVYMTVLNVAIMVVAFRYEVALLGSPAGKVTKNLLKLTFRLCIATSGASLIVVLILYWISPGIFSSLHGIALLIPFGMAVAGIYQMLTYLPIRDRDYALSARSKIWQSVGFSIGGIGFAFLPFAGGGLALADGVGRVFGAVTIFRSKGDLWQTLVSPLSLMRMKVTAIRFRKFGFLTFPGTLLSSLSAAVAPLAFVALFNFEVAGQYALIERFVLMPVGIIAAAVSQVFTGEFSAKYKQDKSQLNSVFRKSLLYLLFVGFLPMAVGAFLSPVVVPFVFGEKWGLAGQLCVIAFPIAYIRFVAIALTMTLIVVDRQSLQFSWEIGRFIITIIVFSCLVLAKVTNPQVVMLWYAAATFVTYAMQIVLADRATKLRNLPPQRETAIRA